MLRIRRVLTPESRVQVNDRLVDRGYDAVVIPDSESALIGFIVNDYDSGESTAVYELDTLINERAYAYQQEMLNSDQEAIMLARDDVSFNLMGSLGFDGSPFIVDICGERPITLDEYQMNASRTAQVSDDPMMMANWTLGLSGEVGEVVELIKKHLFHGKPLDKGELEKELGDVLWYLSMLATQCGISLDSVADKNLSKLEERYPNGFVKGGGIRNDKV